jgi:hypothetical protein
VNFERLVVAPIEVGPLPPGQYRVRARYWVAENDTAGPGPVGLREEWDDCTSFGVLPLVDCSPDDWDVVESDIGPIIVDIPGWSEEAGAGFPGTVEITARAYVPSGQNGPVIGPMVVFTHGMPPPMQSEQAFYTAFNEIGECLARNGFVFVSVRSSAESALVDPYFRARFLLAGTIAAQEHLLDAYGFDFAEIDGQRLAFMGHSRGGEAVPFAAHFAVADGLLPDVFAGHLGATILLAPANAVPRDFPQSVVGSVPATLVIGGTADTDTGITSPAQEYDAFRIEVMKSLSSAYKGFVQIDRARHFGYSNPINQGVPVGDLSNEDHQTVASHYIVSFLRWRLLDSVADRAWFIGAATPMFESENPEPIRTRLLFRQGNEAYVTPPTSLVVEGPAYVDGPVGDVDVASLPLGALFPHGALDEFGEKVQTNYLWTALVGWDEPANPTTPMMTLELQGGGGAPLWIPTSPPPGDLPVVSLSLCESRILG